ncbi:hypothetical protein [Cohnella luojiensis]|uniref:Uncharacterized protein n=1 Tax=Cohnella luojiensis TaxID=652876 RepID=A0A4Y8M0W6_9BACL|nr:hypothetical protein [Cohnella luojiensis]TFE27866.1 hypothetical protein E2980_08775 [Cohnella luojiensis]
MKKKRLSANRSLRSGRLLKSRAFHSIKRRGKLQRPVAKRLSRNRSRSSRYDHSAGVSDGRAWRSGATYDTRVEKLREAIHDKWRRRFLETPIKQNEDWKFLQLRGKSYAAGFMQGSGMHTPLSAVPLRHKAAAVVCAGSNEAALQAVLNELEALPLHEIVIVLATPTDWMYSQARSRHNTVIAHLPAAVDADVGRALGSKLTGADIVLFVDGEHAVNADILARFLWVCDGRLDVALNDLSGQMGVFQKRAGVERFHEFLNASLDRGDLKINSLSSLPFAVSRHALDTLGATALTVPAKAHALAILKGLRIGLGGMADSRRLNGSRGDWRVAAGDHVEAWREAMTARGSRLQFTDSTRNRTALGDWER